MHEYYSRRPSQPLYEELARGDAPLLHSFAEALLFPLYVTDMDDRLLLVNSAFEEVYGWDASELIGRPADLLSPSADRFPLMGGRDLDDLSGRGWKGELTHQRKDGTEFPVFVSSSSVSDRAGRPFARITIVTETTELKQAERAVRESEERYGVVLQSISDEVLIINQEGLIETINDAAANRRSCPSCPVAPGSRLVDIYPEEFARKRVKAVQQVIRNRRPLQILERLQIESQETWLSTKVNPLYDQQGVCAKVVLVSRDVTMEQEREVFLQNFSRSILSAQEVERKRVSRELHDGLAQSLAALRLDLRRLETIPPGEEQRRSGQTAAAIAAVSALLEETRRIAQNLTPAILEDIGLTAAVRKLLTDFAEKSGVDFHWSVDDIDGLFIAAEEIHIYRILQEVASNIERHSGARSVSVSIRNTGSRVEFRVADDGAGFASGHVQTGPAGGGDHRGLRGLKERATLLGGSLEIDSTPGQGTRVALYIPVHRRAGS